MLDHTFDAACVARFTRARRDNNAVGLKALDVVKRQFVVANNANSRVDCSNVLVQVIREAIVIIDK